MADILWGKEIPRRELYCRRDISSSIIGETKGGVHTMHSSSFEIESITRFDWENMSNELLVQQFERLARETGSVEALKQTKREVMRRISNGEGWAYFDTDTSDAPSNAVENP